VRRTGVQLWLLSVLALMGGALFASAVLGQTPIVESFTFYRQLGASAPVNIRYEPLYDQFALVTNGGRLLLVDAATYTTRSVLYENGTYNAYNFSHDGQWLALAIDRRLEIWDTQTGVLSLTIEPDGANSVTGPLMFSDDDSYLLFTAVVAASQATRRSENDTDLLPWLWDLDAARDLADSRLPGRVSAYAFFDYRTGFMYLGPNNTLLAARPGKFEVIDVNGAGLPVVAEFETNRFEEDPVTLWFSDSAGLMYVFKNDTGTIMQVDTSTKRLFEIPLGRMLGARSLRNFDEFPLGGNARMIGEPLSRELNPLLVAWFGYDYRADWNYHPLSIFLLDVLTPKTALADDIGLLIYVFDEELGQGTIEFVRPGNGAPMAIDAEGRRVALRQMGESSPVTIYNFDSGLPILSFDTTLTDAEGDDLFAFNETAEALVAGYQRYDADSGAVIYERLDYNPGYSSNTFGGVGTYFTPDSRGLVTVSGNNWWVWDIETDQVIRREVLDFSGPVIAVSDDATRFLLDVSTESVRGVELYEIGKDERRRLYFDIPSDMTLQNFIPSADWEHFIVTYSALPGTQHAPGGAIALYTVGVGLRWYMAGTDLPSSSGFLSDVGWLDAETIYAVGDGGGAVPDRVVGVAYAPSGVPQCLVERYPAQVDDWTQLWERLAYYQPADDLARLALAVCQAESAEAVEQLYTPTPRPTSIPQAANSVSRITGVPTCLTERYSDQALAFARDWRRLTLGLTEEQTENLASLLCEGLGSVSNVGNAVSVQQVSQASAPDGRVIYAINRENGARVRIPNLPVRFDGEVRPNLELVLQEFRSQFGFTPANAVLSPDRSRLAVATTGGHVSIYQLNKPYEDLALAATAIAIGTAQTNPNAIRVLPASTTIPDQIGQTQPTMTPTFVPTAMPLATQTAPLSQVGQTEVICPAQTVSFAERPTTFTPTGRLIGMVRNHPEMWVLDAESGRFYPDETIPLCGVGVPCTYNLDRSWMIIESSPPVLSRPDGSEQVPIVAASDLSVFDSLRWFDGEQLILRYQGFQPERSADAVLLTRFYNTTTGTWSAPERLIQEVRVNELPTSIISAQPNGGTLLVVTTPVNLPGGTGLQYYLYDEATDEATYFARTDFDQSINFFWDAAGTKLYYSPSWLQSETISNRFSGEQPRLDSDYVYDVATGVHARLDPNVARDLSGMMLDDHSVLNRYVADFPAVGVPELTLAITDLDTGLKRLYCPPAQWRDVFNVAVSPDGRYVAMTAPERGDQSEAVRRYDTLYILDRATGVVVEMPAEMTQLMLWTEVAR